MLAFAHGTTDPTLKNLEATAIPNSPVTGSRATIEKVEITLYSPVCAYNEGTGKCEIIIKIAIKTRYLLEICIFKFIVIISFRL